MIVSHSENLIINNKNEYAVYCFTRKLSVFVGALIKIRSSGHKVGIFKKAVLCQLMIKLRMEPGKVSKRQQHTKDKKTTQGHQ